MAKVLVTGATGFIAGHTILKLLESGHEVRGTARSADKADKLNTTLSAYAGKPIKIELVAANLTSDDGWAEAIHGMDYVLHLASPVPANLPRDPMNLINPARDGALRVLKAAKADGGIKRIVMTSSMAAIAYGWGNKRPEMLTEEHWSNPDNLKDNTAYTRSKAIAEKAAWDYVNGEGKGLELACINPVLVLGPVMSGDFSASVEALTQLLSGKLPATPRVGFGVIDVRDVADAHVMAMTHPDAAGERFLLTTEFLWFSEIADLLRAELPAYAKKLPRGNLPGWVLRAMSLINPALKQVVPELNQKRLVSADKAKRVLGWAPRTSHEAIMACANSLIEHKVV